MASHYSGTERCGSVWACPVCSAVIRNERAIEIEQAVLNWQAKGGSLLFLTLTARHRESDSLHKTLDAVLKSWSGVIRGAPWRKQLDKLKVAGFVRATEVTWGQDNGWHPHLHILLFLEKPISERARVDFEGWLFKRWRARIVGEGLAEPTRLRGIDLRQVDSGGKLVAQYLAKVQGEKAPTATTRVHLELARSDLKSVRGGQKAGGLRLTPFELLDADCALPLVRAEALWNEYVEATRGRRAFHWSKGLRDLTGVNDERSDEEILNDTEQAELLFSIPGGLWDELRNLPDQMAAILEAVDHQCLEAAEALAWGDLYVVEVEDGKLLWVDRMTARCFTPSEALEFFARGQVAA